MSKGSKNETKNMQMSNGNILKKNEKTVFFFQILTQKWRDK